jgi:hypothetical protein
MCYVRFPVVLVVWARGATGEVQSMHDPDRLIGMTSKEDTTHD